MSINISRESAKYPTDPRGTKQIEQLAKLGEFDDIEIKGLPSRPRYLVTYMNSQTRGKLRSATVVSVTNQSHVINRVFVSFFKGLGDDTNPVGVAVFAVPPQWTVDFSSRDLPIELTTCNAICNPELVYDEGRAIVSSMYPEIGVSARVIYTAGERDEDLLSITDSNIVVYGQANHGD
jgi:hypothetical protein